jgi:hypothetical protein
LKGRDIRILVDRELLQIVDGCDHLYRDAVLFCDHAEQHFRSSTAAEAPLERLVANDAAKYRSRTSAA